MTSRTISVYLQKDEIVTYEDGLKDGAEPTPLDGPASVKIAVKGTNYHEDEFLKVLEV